NHGSVRAATLNLVVRCPHAEAAARTDEVLDAIGGSRPLRAIVITPAAGRPRARVSSACWTGGGQEVCAERIAISGDRVALPSGVVSLLVADLPVFVWWQGALPDDNDGVLGELIGVEVVGPPNQAALLAGWLRSRLDRQVGFDVRKAKRLNRVELHCGDDVFSVERVARNHHGIARGPGLPERTFSLPPGDAIS